MASNAAIAGVIVIVIIIVAAVAVALTYRHAPGGSTTTIRQGSPTSQVPVAMTDPPTVPAGTSALVMSYSNVRVHTTGTNSGWVSAQGSGTANLTSLNSSGSAQVLATATMANNATVDMVQYAVTSARITVNGTTYNVAMPPNSTVTAQASGTARVNSTTSIIVNTAPTVTSSFNSTSNTMVYTWAGTTSKAMVYSNSTFTAQARVDVGTTIKLHAGLLAQITAILGISLA